MLLGKFNKDVSFALRRGTIAQVTTHLALDGFAWLRLANARSSAEDEELALNVAGCLRGDVPFLETSRRAGQVAQVASCSIAATNPAFARRAADDTSSRSGILEVRMGGGCNGRDWGKGPEGGGQHDGRSANATAAQAATTEMAGGSTAGTSSGSEPRTAPVGPAAAVLACKNGLAWVRALHELRRALPSNIQVEGRRVAPEAVTWRPTPRWRTTLGSG